MQLPCYVISLPSSDRRARIARDLAGQGLAFQFVDGVRLDRESMARAYDEHRFRRRYGRSSTPNEVACVLAHQRVYAQIAANTAPAAIVLEDDALLEPCFATVVQAAAASLEQGDVALLEHRGAVTPARRGRVSLPAGHELSYTPRWGPQGAVAQIVTRAAAHRLRAFGRPVRSTPDDWHLFSRRVVVRAVSPAIARHDDARPSEIGLDRFVEDLDPPNIGERIRWHVRTSRVWEAQVARDIREVALLRRANVLRALARLASDRSDV